MVDLWGPSAFGAADAAALRPAYAPTNGAGDPDTFYKDCSSPADDDGTEWKAAALNAMLAQMRSAARKSGVPVSNLDDNLLAKAWRSFGMNYRAAGGSANALSLTLDPPVTDWAELANVPLLIKAGAANTSGTVTLSVDGLAAKPVKRLGGADLAIGDIQPGCYYLAAYDGTQVQIVSTIPLSAAVTANPLKLLGFQRYATAGSYSWTVPADVTLIRVTTVGGGGGGGGNNGTSQGASGGSSGAVSIGRHTVTPGASIAVTVGVGGGGGAGGGGTGSTGGTSSMGSLQSSPGGPGGLASGNVNGNASAGTGGEVNHPGGTPQVGGTTLFGGPGSWTPLGYGFGGNGGAGVQPGGGSGSGGSGGGPSTSLGGANGSAGLVLIEW